MIVKVFLHTSVGPVQQYQLSRDLVLVGVHDIGKYAQANLSIASSSDPASLDEGQLYLSGDMDFPVSFELRKNSIIYVSAAICGSPFFSQLLFDEVSAEQLP